jgi:periplasmic divalent cation tolerance protein
VTDKRLVLTTVASHDDAQELAEELVTRRLAACVNIVGPISSTYRWKGEVERSEEFLLLIKTTEAQVAPLEDAVRGLHSYEVPELIAFTVDSGLPGYLDWIAASVGK